MNSIFKHLNLNIKLPPYKHVDAFLAQKNVRQVIKYEMCVNGCVLYNKQNAEAKYCSNCGQNRYDPKNKPTYFYYIPVSDTLKHRFSQDEWKRDSVLHFPKQTDTIADVTDSDTWTKLKRWNHGTFARYCTFSIQIHHSVYV